MGWAALERRFFQILDRALLGACALLLVGTLTLVGIATVKLVLANFPGLDHSYVSVPYTPLKPISPQKPAVATNQQPPDTLTATDLQLLDLAAPGCQAIGRFASTISNGKLFIHGAGLTVCEKAQLETAKKFGDRATNFLSEFSSYFTQLSNDPHIAARYLYETDDQKREVVAGVIKDFTSKFQAKISAQNARNNTALQEASAQHLGSMNYFILTCVAYLAFLTVAFLIALLRVQRHLQQIADKEGLPQK
jgi:hypothetical protein